MQINWIAIFVAALIPMILGFIWYHEKVFGATWMKSIGMTKEKALSVNMMGVFTISFICALILSWEMYVLSTHDMFVAGALQKANGGGFDPQPGSIAAQWLQTYVENFAKDNHTFSHGAVHGIIMGLFIVLPITITEGLYEQRPWSVRFIKAGYWVLSFLLMGGLLAAWR